MNKLGRPQGIAQAFKEGYPHICCSDEVLDRVISEVIQHNKPETPLEVILDLVADGILSQGLAEEVIE